MEEKKSEKKRFQIPSKLTQFLPASSKKKQAETQEAKVENPLRKTIISQDAFKVRRTDSVVHKPVPIKKPKNPYIDDEAEEEEDEEENWEELPEDEEEEEELANGVSSSDETLEPSQMTPPKKKTERLSQKKVLYNPTKETGKKKKREEEGDEDKENKKPKFPSFISIFSKSPFGNLRWLKVLQRSVFLSLLNFYTN